MQGRVSPISFILFLGCKGSHTIHAAEITGSHRKHNRLGDEMERSPNPPRKSPKSDTTVSRRDFRGGQSRGRAERKVARPRGGSLDSSSTSDRKSLLPPPGKPSTLKKQGSRISMYEVSRQRSHGMTSLFVLELERDNLSLSGDSPVQTPVVKARSRRS